MQQPSDGQVSDAAECGKSILACSDKVAGALVEKFRWVVIGDVQE